MNLNLHYKGKRCSAQQSVNWTQGALPRLTTLYVIFLKFNLFLNFKFSVICGSNNFL